MTVHVFSDDNAIRDSLDVLFQANDVAVRTYDSLDELMRGLPENSSSCVLLDVSANPFELLSRLRSRGLSPPVIVLASALPAIPGKQPNIIGLQKPVAPKDLLAAIQKAVTKRN